MNDRVEELRKAIVNSPHDNIYTKLANECGLSRDYIRKFAIGFFDEPTVNRYDAMQRALERLNGATAE